MKGTGQHLCERPLIVQQPTSEAREQYVELLNHLQSLQYTKGQS